MILYVAEGFAETLEMDELPLPEITDGIAHIRVFCHTQNIIIGGACLLLCCAAAGAES